VTPSGGLLLYGTEHDNDGPGGSVKAEEFRPAPHRSSCTDINDAWVELYDDTGFDGDRSQRPCAPTTAKLLPQASVLCLLQQACESKQPNQEELSL